MNGISGVIKSGNQDSLVHRLEALDCRTPTRVQTGLWREMCGTWTNETFGYTDKKMVTILQYSDALVLDALRCTKYSTRHEYFCGRWSHLKLFAPPTVHKKESFDVKQCAGIAKHAIYQERDGQSIPLEPNQRVQFGYLEHGSITLYPYNTACEGAKLQRNGEFHDQVLPVISSTVYSTKVKLEISKDKVIDLESHVELPFICSKDYHCTSDMFESATSLQHKL